MNEAQEPSPCFTIDLTVPSPGRSVTRARRLIRKQTSKLRESDRPQIRGSEQGCELPPLRHGRRIWRGPRSPESELERLVCSAS